MEIVGALVATPLDGKHTQDASPSTYDGDMCRQKQWSFLRIGSERARSFIVCVVRVTDTAGRRKWKGLWALKHYWKMWKSGYMKGEGAGVCRCWLEAERGSFWHMRWIFLLLLVEIPPFFHAQVEESQLESMGVMSHPIIRDQRHSELAIYDEMGKTKVVYV